jgi:acetyl esterase/lipase
MARTALVLAVALVAAAAVMLLPMPVYGLWLARFVLRETSLAIVVLAMLVAGLAGLGQRKAPRTSLLALALALLAGGAAARPFVETASVFEEQGVEFSFSDYLLGARPAPLEPRRFDAAPGLPVDVYRAPGEGRRPLVAVVHGGSWTGGGLGEAAHLDRILATAGYVVADVSYRLAPAHLFPAAVSDVKCALGRLRARADEFGIDPARVAILGRSAGGELALVAAYSAGDARLPPACEVEDAPVSAVVSIYAPTDLAWGHAHPSRPDVIHGPATLETYLGGTPEAKPDAYALGSATSWVARALPPTLLIHGLADQLVSPEHARRLAAALGVAGRPVELLLVPFADHGFDRRSGGLGEQLARARIRAFLRDVFPPPPIAPAS